MAETPAAEKQDSLEDSLSSEDWTIIDKKESKVIDGSEEEQEVSKKNKEPKETVVTDDACQSEESIKNEVIEKGEEADEEDREIEDEEGEKDIESDDVSILSDESEEGSLELESRIEKFEQKIDSLNRQSSSIKALPSPPQCDGNSTSNTLVTCSIVALIFGVLIAGQIVEFQKEKSNYASNAELETKLKDLSVIEEKLKELNNVKQAIDQLRLSLPDIKSLNDQQKSVHISNKNNMPKLKMDIFENINLENILNWQSSDDVKSNNDKLETLAESYYNFCSIISKIDSTNSMTDSGLCITPKALSELINFKKNLKQVSEKTVLKTESSDKRFFMDVERMLDSTSESLLSELSVIFSKYSIKIQERFDRLEKTVNKRLCSLNNKGKSNDNFIKSLLETEFSKDKCKENSNAESVIDDLKSNITWKKEKNNENKKRVKYEDFKKNGYKYDHKNIKNKKNKIIRDFSQEIEEDDDNNENSEEIFDTKSKGELKNDNWKKTKYDSRERYSNEERKSNRNDERSESHEFDSSNEINDQDYNRNFETKRERYYDQKFGSRKDQEVDRKFKKKDQDSNEFFDNKKRNRDYKFDPSINNHEYDEEFEYKKRDRYFDKQEKPRFKYESNVDEQRENSKEFSDYENPEFNKKDKKMENKYNQNYKEERNGNPENRRKRDFNEHAEFSNKKHSDFNKKDKNFENKYSQNSKEDHDFKTNFEDKRSHNYYDEDSKFNVYLENDMNKNSEEKQKIKKDREYIIRPENFKESKYSKYEGKDYKKEKYYQDGEWQMQRGKARENLRNSDWYFVRADLHKKPRNQDETEDEEEVTQRPTPPLRPSPPPKQQHYRKTQGEETGEKEPLRKRLFRKVRQNFLNSKLKLLQFKLPFW